MPREGVLLLIGAVLLFGLPHGAMDLMISKDAGLWSDRGGFVRFHLVYLGLAASTVAAFIALPALALGAFLLISLWHFAEDWPCLPRPLRLGAASVIILGPTISHPQEVARIFETVSGLSVSLPGALPGLPVAAAFVVIGGSLLLALRYDRRAGLEIAAVAALSVLLPPLLFFAAYFTLLHSPRHLLRHRELVDGPGGRVVVGIYTALAMGVVIALAFFLPGEIVTSWNGAGIRALFVGLAALTLPHMLLLEYASRRERTRSRPKSPSQPIAKGKGVGQRGCSG